MQLSVRKGVSLPNRKTRRPGKPIIIDQPVLQSTKALVVIEQDEFDAAKAKEAQLIQAEKQK